MKLFNKLIEKIKECIQGYLLYLMFEKDGQVKIVESEEQENAWIYFTNNSIFPWRLLFLSNIIWIDWLYNRKIKRSQRKQGRKMIEKMKVAPNTNRGGRKYIKISFNHRLANGFRAFYNIWRNDRISWVKK